ncbi:DUF2188 domain-containing protein [Ureibacillus thermophilus]|uniref:DUF2188 domain-containing protein n=1 Tax=Ureibacillus thermophilus TaxID=367743 RepID=UPI003617FEE5
MSRTVYHVTYSNELEKWKVIKENSSRVSSYHDTKSAAIEEAKRLAKKNIPSQVKVHNQDGTISDEWTYGDDPFPPRG